MPLNNLFYAWVILHGALCLTIVAETIIWRNQEDVFEIPHEKCWNDTEKQCNSMGGRQLIYGTGKYPCICQCNVNDKNVFGWFDNEWKCERNSVARNLAEQGCTLKRLHDYGSETPLITAVPYRKRYSKEIDWFHTGFSGCQLKSSFFYLDCKILWHMQVPSSSGRGPFKIKKYGYYSDKYYLLYIRPRSFIDSTHYASNLYGHIIRLEIICSSGSRSKTFCVVLKVEGRQKCPLDYPTMPTQSTTRSFPLSTTTSTTIPPTSPITKPRPSIATTTTTTLSPPTTTTSTTTLLPTTQVATHSTGAKKSPQTSPSTFSTAHSHSTNISTKGATESTVDTTTGHAKPTNETPKPGKHNRDSSKDDKGGRGGIIAGVVGGLVGLIIILVILAFLWFKRKRNYHPKRETTQEIANNDVYDEVVLDNHSSRPPGQLPSGDDEYSYAYMDTHPIVIKDQTGTAFQAQDVPNARVGHLKTNSGSPIYHTLEDPDYTKLNAVNHTEGSYNVLERQPEAGWKTPSNPEGAVDKTLEAPSYSKIHKTNKRHQRGEPSYNVLKRGPVAKCNQQNEPYYDALVKPESSLGLGNNPEAPIYNMLEDPNDVALKKAGALGNLNSKQKCPIYNVLEGPNTANSPVYAELEKPGSKENHICGALNSPTSGNADLDYNDDYSNVGDVIYHNDAEVVDSTVYQELNQNRQSSIEKQYEPLRHSKVFIGMKDMKNPGQSHT